MGGDGGFWVLFGGIFLAVGVCFVAASLGVNLFADPETLNGASPWIFFAAGLATSGFGGFIVQRTLGAAARDRRLMETGIGLSATVISVRRSRVEINRQTRWLEHYRYEYSGQSLEGESRALPSDAVERFHPGGGVNIKVDAERPLESLLLGPT
jgi:hypothetical protein